MYLNNNDQWNAILKKVEQGIKNVFPIEGKTGKIELISVAIPDKANISIENQKSRLLQGNSLSTPVYGEFKLSRKNGNTERARIKILDLPVLTDRGTFIVQGKDYSVFNQVRLKPGVYVRKTNESDAVFADFNLGKGLGFEIHMDNAGVFSIRFDKSKLSTSSKKIPLYPLLHGMEEKGMLEVYEQEYAGKIRKYSHITREGKKILDAKKAEWKEYQTAVSNVLAMGV